MIKLITIFIHLIVLKQSNSIESDINHSLSNVYLRAWSSIQFKAQDFIGLITSRIETEFNALITDNNISSKCVNDVKLVLSSANKLEVWAVKMLDSWGKFPPSGLLEGTFTDLGNFDECLQVSSDFIEPQYCSIFLRPLLPPRPRFHNLLHQIEHLKPIINQSNIIGDLAAKAQFFYYVPIRIGVCLPTSCSQSEVNRLANQEGKMLSLQGTSFKCDEPQSRESKLNRHQNHLNILQQFSVLLSTFIMMTLMGTLIDVWIQYGTVKPVATEPKPDSYLIFILLAFSLKQNLRSLLTTKTSNKELKCLNGIRFLTMAWIIMGHTAVWIHFQAFSQSYNILEILTPFHAQLFFNSSLSVDTFFLVSGLLTSYVTWTTTEGDSKNFSSVWFILGRYFRLTPSLIAVICITFYLPYFGSGPLWHEIIDPVVQTCQDNWWVNMLYLQNYINTERICLLPTWWLANDMHFHIISLIILIAMLKKRIKLGLTINFSIIILFVFITWIYNFHNDLPPTVITTQPQIEEVWQEIAVEHFWKPYVHVGPFFIGLYLGFILAERKFRKFTQFESMLGWAVSLGMMFIILKLPYFWNNGYPYSKIVAASYQSVQRIIWSLAIAWIIYISACGHGGLIGSFLSLNVFAPLARLSYMVYLSHMWIIWIYMGTRRNLSTGNNYTGLYMFLSHWILAYFLGFILALFFESPFLVLQKSLFRRQQKYTSTKNEIDCAA